MVEKSLTPRERGTYLLCGFLLLAVATFFGITASFAPELKADFFPFILAYFIITSVASFAIAVLFLRGFWSGTVRRASEGAGRIGVAYLGLSGWIFMLMARHVPEFFRDDVRVLGLILLIYAAVAWIRQRIARAELSTHEKLLELELRMADLSDAIKVKSASS